MQANLFENTSGLKTLLEKVDRLKAELDALRPLNTEQEARVMQKFRLDWNYHSNSINKIKIPVKTSKVFTGITKIWKKVKPGVIRNYAFPEMPAAARR